MLVALIAAAICSTANLSPGREWLTGDYRAVPVLSEHQEVVLESLGGASFRPIDDAAARRLAGDNGLPDTLNYFVARTAYRGAESRGTYPPAGVHLGLDVDSTGLGVVVSFRFTDKSAEVEVAAVLGSQTEVRSLMTHCIWAR